MKKSLAMIDEILDHFDVPRLEHRRYIDEDGNEEILLNQPTNVAQTLAAYVRVAVRERELNMKSLTRMEVQVLVSPDSNRVVIFYSPDSYNMLMRMSTFDLITHDYESGQWIKGKTIDDIDASSDGQYVSFSSSFKTKTNTQSYMTVICQPPYFTGLCYIQDKESYGNNKYSCGGSWIKGEQQQHYIYSPSAIKPFIFKGKLPSDIVLTESESLESVFLRQVKRLPVEKIGIEITPKMSIKERQKIHQDFAEAEFKKFLTRPQNGGELNEFYKRETKKPNSSLLIQLKKGTMNHILKDTNFKLLNGFLYVNDRIVHDFTDDVYSNL